LIIKEAARGAWNKKGGKGMKLTKLFANLCLLSVLLMLAGCQDDGKAASSSKVSELNVFNWSAYMPPEVLEAFTAETGIKVNYEEYDSNETMMAKINAGAKYDIAFPTQDFVPPMVELGLLHELDLSRIPNLANVNKSVIDSTQNFDPGNQYSVPYNIGAIGVMYWKDKVSNPGTSVHILERPELKGKTLIIDDTREVFSAALKALGYSVNSTNPSEIDAATQLILAWKDNALMFENDQMPTMFANKEVWVAFGYLENVLSEMDPEQKEGVGYFMTDEANSKFLDNMVILKDTKNLDGAYAFINFIYRPENLAKIADLYGYPGISDKALAYRNEKPYYTTEDLERFEFRKPLGDALDLYTKAWEDTIKIGQ